MLTQDQPALKSWRRSLAAAIGASGRRSDGGETLNVRPGRGGQGRSRGEVTNERKVLPKSVGLTSTRGAVVGPS